MPDETPDAPRSGFILDLSSAAPGKPKRPKGFVPVVQKTINLTTKKRDEAPAEPEAPRSAPPRRDEPRRTDLRRGDARPADRSSSGTSLADLLDEATLARLRGGR